MRRSRSPHWPPSSTCPPQLGGRLSPPSCVCWCRGRRESPRSPGFARISRGQWLRISCVHMAAPADSQHSGVWRSVASIRSSITWMALWRRSLRHHNYRSAFWGTDFSSRRRSVPPQHRLQRHECDYVVSSAATVPAAVISAAGRGEPSLKMLGRDSLIAFRVSTISGADASSVL